MERKIASAIGWNVISGALTLVLQIGTTALMARLLTVNDYGAYAFGYAISVVVMHLTQRGLSTAILLQIDDEKQAISTAFTASIIMGVFGALILLLLGIVMHLYNVSPIQVNILIFSAIPLFVQIASSPAQAILIHQLRFREISIANLFGFITGNVVVAPLAAFLGLGAWSLAVGTAVTTIASVIPLMLKTKQYLRVTRDFRETAVSLRRMVAMNGLRGLDIGWVQAPIVILSLRIPAGAVGIYQRMQFLADLSMQLTAWRISSVLYASATRDERTKENLLQNASIAFGILSLVVFPICGFTLVAAPYLIQTLLGEQWVAGVQALQVIVFAFAVATLNHAPSMVLEISGNLRARYIVSAITLAINAIGLVVVPANASLAALSIPAAVSAICGTSFAWYLLACEKKFYWHLVVHARGGLLMAVATVLGALAGEGILQALSVSRPLAILALQVALAGAATVVAAAIALRLREHRALLELIKGVSGKNHLIRWLLG